MSCTQKNKHRLTCFKPREQPQIPFLLGVLNHVNEKTRKIGQSFIVGYQNYATVKHLTETGLIGGIFITKANVVGKNMEEFRTEIVQLQAMRVLSDLPPLIVTADQKGGMVSRFSPVIGSSLSG